MSIAVMRVAVQWRKIYTEIATIEYWDFIFLIFQWLGVGTVERPWTLNIFIEHFYISVIGGWDGRKALNSVEFYNEQKREWEESRRTRLAQERRWAAATQISHKLFSYCVQKRSWSFSHTHRAPQHPRKFLPTKQIHTKYPQLWFKRDTLEAKAALLWDRGWRSVID